MKKFFEKYGSWAVVTGASSGIGEEFCRQLAAQKFNLVLIARRTERLQQLASSLAAAHSIQTKVVSVDLASDNFLQRIIAETEPLDVGLLVNNAGFALIGRFLDHKLEDELRLLYVNCRAPMILAHHFGRKMAQQKRGGIINVSSAAAFMPLPFWTSYSASKIYSLYFSEGLWFELKKNSVDVLALCPGSTRTEFATVAGTSMQGMQVEPVVRLAIKNLGRKISVISGIGNAVAAMFSRVISRKSAVIIGSKVVGGRFP